MEEPPNKVATFSKLTRRQLLRRSATGVMSASLLSTSLNAFSTTKTEASFLQSFMMVSKVLTARTDLLNSLGQRFFSALCERDSQFGARVQRLEKAIAKSKSGQLAMDFSPEQQRTAKQVVGAWYTGMVGEGRHKQVVTYRHALAFRAVNDVLDIRSYGSGKPGVWAQKPVERKV